MIEVVRVALDLDLSVFSHWLSAQNISHRIAEDSGAQVLYVPEQAQALIPQIREALQRFVSDPEVRRKMQAHSSAIEMPPVSGIQTIYPRTLPRQAPLVFLALGMSILIALLTGFGEGGALLRMCLIVDPFQLDFRMTDLSSRVAGLLAMLELGQLWRLISPDFIHFSAMHLIFNALMLWILGGQLELRKGSAAFLWLFLFVSGMSNFAQLLSSHYLFGGLSGVVYGLFGYSWIWRKHDPAVFMPEAFWRFALVWLLVGFTPLTEWLGIGKMANAAHVSGLLAGMLWGILALGIPGREGKEKKPNSE